MLGRSPTRRLAGVPASGSVSDPLERTREVGPQVVRMLEANAEPKQAARHRFFSGPTVAAVDHRLDAAEAGAADDQSQHGRDGVRGGGVCDLEGDDRPEAVHLALRSLMERIGGETRIAYADDPRVGGEALG